jgi:hypothetical protein
MELSIGAGAAVVIPSTIYSRDTWIEQCLFWDLIVKNARHTANTANEELPNRNMFEKDVSSFGLYTIRSCLGSIESTISTSICGMLGFVYALKPRAFGDDGFVWLLYDVVRNIVMR